jgi:hypothetical protein
VFLVHTMKNNNEEARFSCGAWPRRCDLSVLVAISAMHIPRCGRYEDRSLSCRTPRISATCRSGDLDVAAVRFRCHQGLTQREAVRTPALS